MLDAFLEVACGHTKEAEARAHTTELMKQLPDEVLYDIATGKEKLAYISDHDHSFLQKFKGTPLFDQAVQLEQAELELKMEQAQERQQEDQTWRQRDAQRDALCIQKKMLELELAKLEDESGEGPEESEEVVGDGTDAPAEGDEKSAQVEHFEGKKAPPYKGKADPGEPPAAMKEKDSQLENFEGKKAPKYKGKADPGQPPAAMKKAAMTMKAAFIHDCDDWLSKFKGTPLFEQAVQIEEALLAQEAEEISDRNERGGERQQRYQQQDMLRLKKRQLSLELVKHQEGMSDEEFEAMDEEAVEPEEGAELEEAGVEEGGEEEVEEGAVDEKEASARMKTAMLKIARASALEKIAGGAAKSDLTELEKQALGGAMMAGLKGMGRFMGQAGKTVSTAAQQGGMAQAGQALKGVGQAGMQQAGQFTKKNPMAALGLAGGAGLAAGGLGGAAVG